jgi:hypothetical protein
LNFDRYKIPAWATYEDFCRRDFHSRHPRFVN